MKKKTNNGLKIICLNRKASFNYFFENLLEAGIVLKGSEIKSVRDGKVNIADSYAVEKNGELYMTLGTPGGSTIITSVVQTILNVHEFNMTMQEAVNSPRFHHQWKPDSIRIESDYFDSKVKDELLKSGYRLTDKGSIGRVDGILVKKGKTLEGGADKRGDDTAVGF